MLGFLNQSISLQPKATQNKSIILLEQQSTLEIFAWRFFLAKS